MKVFIFGSNADGFHGAGAAAYAFTGKHGNVWRTDPRCSAAIRGVELRGLMAQWGVSRGFSRGMSDKCASYAIQTVVKPGMRRSVPLDEIREQVEEGLVPFMREHPTWDFAMSRFGIGLAGYTEPELRPIYALILNEQNGRMAKT